MSYQMHGFDGIGPTNHEDYCRKMKRECVREWTCRQFLDKSEELEKEEEEEEPDEAEADVEGPCDE